MSSFDGPLNCPAIDFHYRLFKLNMHSLSKWRQLKENSNQKFFLGAAPHSHPHISSIYIYTVGRLHFHVESLRHLPLVFFFIDDIFIIHYDSVNPPYEPNPLSLLNKISQIYIVGLDEGKNNTTTTKNAHLRDEKIDSRPLYNREKRMSMIFHV